MAGGEVRQRLAAVFAACSVVLSGHAFAQPDDIAGWDQTNWGMTRAELSAIYGDRVKTEPGWFGDFNIGEILTMETYRLADVDFEVTFYDTVDKGLSGVDLMNATEAFEPDAVDKFADEAERLFGPPNILSDVAGENEGDQIEGYRLLILEWRFPSSVIEYRGEAREFVVGGITIASTHLWLNYRRTLAARN